MSDRSEHDVVTRHRGTKVDARRRGSAESGFEAAAPDQEDESGVSDLGRNEPTVVEAPAEQNDAR